MTDNETIPNNNVNSTSKESINLKIKNIMLQDDMLTIFTDSGVKLYSDTIQNYTLRFYDVKSPIIGKNYLEVIFSHPNIDHFIVLKAKDNDPTFAKLKHFCKYMKNHAKVNIAENRNQLIKFEQKWNKKYILLCRILALLLLLIGFFCLPFGLILFAIAIWILYVTKCAKKSLSANESSLPIATNITSQPTPNLQSQHSSTVSNNEMAPLNNLLYEHNSIRLEFFNSFTVAATGEKWLCVYKYENVEIFRPDASFSEIFEYDVVDIIPEPTNPYDPNAISIQFHKNILGYLYKGTIQDMVHDFLKRKELIRATIQKIDGTKIYLKLFFCKPRNLVLPQQESIIVNLSGNTNENMQENIEYCQIGDKISVDYDFDEEKFCVLCNNLEIGYVPKSQHNILQKLEDKKYEFSGEILDIKENKAEKNVVTVKIQPE